MFVQNTTPVWCIFNKCDTVEKYYVTKQKVYSKKVKIKIRGVHVNASLTDLVCIKSDIADNRELMTAQASRWNRFPIDI